MNHQRTGIRGFAALEEAIEKYFRGIYTGDIGLLRSAFHAKAELFGEVKGTPYQRDLETYLSAVANRQSPQSLGEHFAMRIISMEQQGPVARAAVSVPMLGYNYVDFLNFVHSNGNWSIVNKTFTHIERNAEKENS